MKAYLNPHDRFAQRMKASLTKKDADSFKNEQKELMENDLETNKQSTIQGK